MSEPKMNTVKSKPPPRPPKLPDIKYRSKAVLKTSDETNQLSQNTAFATAQENASECQKTGSLSARLRAARSTSRNRNKKRAPNPAPQESSSFTDSEGERVKGEGSQLGAKHRKSRYTSRNRTKRKAPQPVGEEVGVSKTIMAPDTEQVNENSTETVPGQEHQLLTSQIQEGFVERSCLGSTALLTAFESETNQPQSENTSVSGQELVVKQVTFSDSDTLIDDQTFDENEIDDDSNFVEIGIEDPIAEASEQEGNNWEYAAPLVDVYMSPSDESDGRESVRGEEVELQEGDLPNLSFKPRTLKDSAPWPPSFKVPLLNTVALRLNPKGYAHITHSAKTEDEFGNDTEQRDRKSLELLVETPSVDKMPPAKGFFKTLLRKSKSKHEVSASEFECIEEPHQNGHYGNNYLQGNAVEDRVEHEEQELDTEGKLPKEFLDTWVSSTTHQLLDEMDLALKGVWPYDKKEESLSAYGRRSVSSSHLQMEEDEPPQPSYDTIKRKSKQLTASSAWSDRGRGDTESNSNFILKEKTKRSSANSVSGSLRNSQSHHKSTSSLHSTANKSKSLAAAAAESRQSKAAVTELDGSAPKSKYREQFLKKMQRDSMSHRDSMSQQGTLKKNTSSSELLTLAPYDDSVNYLNVPQGNNNSKQASKGSSAASTPPSSSRQKVRGPAAPIHGRQSSVPGSTYSGSSSGQSTHDYRGKEDPLEFKSSSLSPAHDSGYESGTVRSRRQDTLALPQSVSGGQLRHEYGTLRPKKEGMQLSTNQDYESSTLMRPRKEISTASADYATLKRVKRSPTLSLTSRSTPKGSNTAIDSVPLCFEQLTTMNVSTLQQLCVSYLNLQRNALAERQKVACETENTTGTTAGVKASPYRWFDIGLMDELNPLFISNKVVLYKAYWRNNPQETFTVMLSLKEPSALKTFKPNLLAATTTFEANVAPHLIPNSLYVGQKLYKQQQTTAGKEQTTPKSDVGSSMTDSSKRAKSVLIAKPQTNVASTHRMLSSHRSVDDTLLHTEPKQSFKTLASVSSTDGMSNRDSVFTNQTSCMTEASAEQIEAEQAAVDSILMAVADEHPHSGDTKFRKSSPSSTESSSPTLSSDKRKQSDSNHSEKSSKPKSDTQIGTKRISVNSEVHHQPASSSPGIGNAANKSSSKITPYTDNTNQTAAIVSPSKKLSLNKSHKGKSDGWESISSQNGIHEPVNLSSRIDNYSSSIKKPVAERYNPGRLTELSPNTYRKPSLDTISISSISSIGSRQNGGIHGLKTSGLVKNRIANLNSNNNNSNEEEDEDDLMALNSNNNNNMDEMADGAAGGGEGEFVFASHLMEMAGGERYLEVEEDELDPPAHLSTVTSATTSLARLSCADKVTSVQNVTCFVTILPTLEKVESIKTYLERMIREEREKNELELDVIFILLQTLNIIFGLHESHLRLDSISTSDFLVITDTEGVSTLHCHMINTTQASQQKIGLTCEKLRMFLMQLSHSVQSLQKSIIFTTIDDLVQSSEDLGDLKTIYAILQYLLWGPKDDEVKVITLAEHRRQAFELWLQLARGKQLSSLALKPIDNLKAFMVTSFLANSNGTELFKITKLLNTY